MTNMEVGLQSNSLDIIIGVKTATKMPLFPRCLGGQIQVRYLGILFGIFDFRLTVISHAPNHRNRAKTTPRPPICNIKKTFGVIVPSLITRPNDSLLI